MDNSHGQKHIRVRSTSIGEGTFLKELISTEEIIGGRVQYTVHHMKNYLSYFSSHTCYRCFDLTVYNPAKNNIRNKNRELNL